MYLLRPDVGGAAAHHGQRRLGASAIGGSASGGDEAVRHLVGRAVAPAGDGSVQPAFGGLARQLGRVTGRLRERQRGLPAGQAVDGGAQAVDWGRAARDRIQNEERSLGHGGMVEGSGPGVKGQGTGRGSDFQRVRLGY